VLQRIAKVVREGDADGHNRAVHVEIELHQGARHLGNVVVSLGVEADERRGEEDQKIRRSKGFVWKPTRNLFLIF
jgi:hypothetical protein